MEYTLIIEIQGGALQNVYSDMPEDIKLDVRLMDDDNRRANPEGDDAVEYSACKEFIQNKKIRMIF